MHTTLFLVRHGDTEWAAARRILGRRDLGLSKLGRQQAAATAERLAKLKVAEILSSPLVRAVETAEQIASQHKLEIARDVRLTDVHAGSWEGRSFDNLLADTEYQKVMRDAVEGRLPDKSETLAMFQGRVVASIEQALEDVEIGANIVVVSHAAVIRVLLSHYLGMNPANFHRLRVGPGSISVLRFDSARELPRVLAVNYGDDLEGIIR